MRRPYLLSNRLGSSGQSGQAFIEFVFVAIMLMVLLLGLIDFGRAIYDRQILTNLSREGSNLASRGTTFSDTVAAVTNSANPLDFRGKGRVIVTQVFNSNGTFRITNQQSSTFGIAATSRVGTGVGSPATLPTTAVALPQSNQYLYVTEVFYLYQPITPVGRLLSIALPTNLYDVAFF